MKRTKGKENIFANEMKCNAISCVIFDICFMLFLLLWFLSSHASVCLYTHTRTTTNMMYVSDIVANRFGIVPNTKKKRK